MWVGGECRVVYREWSLCSLSPHQDLYLVCKHSVYPAPVQLGCEFEPVIFLLVTMCTRRTDTRALMYTKQQLMGVLKHKGCNVYRHTDTHTHTYLNQKSQLVVYGCKRSHHDCN